MTNPTFIILSTNKVKQISEAMPLITADINQVLSKYERLRDGKFEKLISFHSRKVPFLVSLYGPNSFYTDSNSIENAFNANLSDFNAALDIASDTLPFLEPWFGTGTCAEAFGCEYLWRENESPACHYKFKSIDEVRHLTTPKIQDGKIFKMVLDAITYFREKTRDKLPICVTDTQSANDTATLILDAVEVFTASYSEPDLLHQFLSKITDLIIEFSKMQIAAIGPCLSSPGHIMSCSTTGGSGLSISDDNLAVCSPSVNEKFLLPYDEQIGAQFGGLAIHSCGNWSHTMPIAAKLKSLMMIDCAISIQNDPNPNEPEAVRDAFSGTDIIVQARIGSDIDSQLDLIKRIWAPDIRLIVRSPGIPQESQYQYNKLNDCLKKLYQI